jgi:hypothetical protein
MLIKSHPVLQSIVSSIPIIFPGSSLSEWMGRPQVQPGTCEISVDNFSMEKMGFHAVDGPLRNPNHQLIDGKY